MLHHVLDVVDFLCVECMKALLHFHGLLFKSAAGDFGILRSLVSLCFVDAALIPCVLESGNAFALFQVVLGRAFSL
jgi:hypothetical protein